MVVRGVTWELNQSRTACLHVSDGTLRIPIDTHIMDRTFRTGGFRIASAGQQKTPPDPGVTQQTKTRDGSTAI